MHSLFNLFSLSPSLSSNPIAEHSTSSAGDLRKHFLNSNFAAGPKAVARPAPGREPETILLDESEEADDACETGEDGLPKPIQIGNILFKCEVPTHNAKYSFPDNAAGKRMLKRYLETHPDNDFDFDYGNTTAAKLPATNK